MKHLRAALADISKTRILREIICSNMEIASFEQFFQAVLCHQINRNEPSKFRCDRERKIDLKMKGENGRPKQIKPDLLIYSGKAPIWHSKNSTEKTKAVKGIVEIKMAWTDSFSSGSARANSKGKQIVGDLERLEEVNSEAWKAVLVIVCGASDEMDKCWTQIDGATQEKRSSQSRRIELARGKTRMLDTKLDISCEVRIIQLP